MVFYILLSLVVTLNIFLALFIIAKNYRSHLNISFASFVCTIAFWIIVNALSNHVSTYTTAFLYNKLIFFIGPYIVFTLLYFSLVFPRYTFTKRIDSLLLLSIIPVFIVNILTAINLVITKVTFLPGGGTGVVFGFGIWLFALQFIGYFLVSIFIMARKFFKSKGYEKAQLQYLLFGITITMVVGTVTNLLIPLFFNSFEASDFGPFSSIAVIGFTAYAILRHRLLDIRLVVARTVAYTLLLVILSAFYTSSIFFIGRLWLNSQLPNTQIIVNAALALFVAFTSQPLKNLLERTTVKVFFKGTYNTANLLARLTRILAVTIQLQEVTKETLHELLETVHITGGAFIIFEEETLYPPITDSMDADKIDLDVVKKFMKLRRTLILQEETDPEVKQLMHVLDASIILPLYDQVKTHGMLLLGDKKSGEMYSQQDIKVLEIFGPEVSVAVQNAKAYEEIKQFNITLHQEVEHATHDLKEANEHLQELDQLKDEFVSLASHELRTPMTIIKNYLWMLSNDTKNPLETKQKEYVDRAYSSVNRLINLVNDMLNVSRIESGRFTINLEKVDITSLVKDIVAEILPRAQELGITLVTVDAKKPLPAVSADSERIKQVVINLIGNALKFTPRDGRITVWLEAGTTEAIIHVSDTGKGIAVEDMRKLFQKFSIVGNKNLRKLNSQGTGLGLYLSKSIINLHKGKIGVYSKGEDQGTTFTFTLPYVHPTQKDLVPTQQLHTQQAYSPIN